MKSLRLSILAMSIGAIVGCGGEDSSGTDNKTEATVYQAEVADEHLQDALVWLDLNHNYQLDAGEPNSYTDSTGNALLDVAALDNVPQAYSLIASAIKNRTINKTTGEKVSKSYLMVAPAGIQRISPVSHLLYSKQEAEGLAFEQATAMIAAIIGEVSEQELLNFLNKQENKKLQALSHSLASVMPEAETPFTHQQLVQSHPVLERAVDAFNHSAVKTLEADLGLVSGENPISAVADETVDPNASEPSNNKQTPEVGLQVPSILGSPSITEIDISNSNQPQESAPVNAIMPTLEVASETPMAENQLPNETLQISEVVTTGTDTQGTTQLPESNPSAPDQPLSTEQGPQDSTSSGVVTETETTGNSLPNEALQTSEVVTSGTDTQVTTPLPESNLSALDQPLSTAQGSQDGTSSGVVTETETTGNSLPNETPPTVELVTTGTGTEATTQNSPPNNADVQTLETLAVTDLGTLLTRISKDLVSAEEGSAQAQSKSLDALASELIFGLQADGRWLDIDYERTNNYRWPAEQHLKRLETIAAAFRKTNNQQYKLVANKALNLWLITKPVMTGWWSEYGEFHSLAKVAFLLGDGLQVDLKQQVISLLANARSKHQLGLNRVDEAVTSIYYGLLSQQESLLSTGFEELAQIILDTAMDSESPDWSAFLSQQLHSGKTGEETFYSILRWAYNVKDLPWKFSEYSAQILASILLDGIRWMQSFEQFGSDVLSGEISQQIETTQSGASISNLPTSMDMVAALFPTRYDEAIAYKGQVYNNQNTGLNGFKQFLLADSTVTATDNFMFGIKMDSMRALPEADTNNEAYLKFWLGLGGTSLIQTGKEYESLNSVLDFTKIPGVTTPEYPQAPTYDSDTLRNMEFYGGATNGKVGVTTASINMSAYRVVGSGPTQQYVWTPSTTVRDELYANKSWFSFGEQIVVLGSGISSTHLEPVFTTINQTALKGPVTLSNRDNLVMDNHNVSAYPWIHHDGVGYVFWDNLDRYAVIKKRNATNVDGTSISKDVFTLTIPHGSEPKDKSYQYIILPNIDVQKTSEYQQNIPVKVLSNTRGIHAVEDTRKNIISAVFFVASELEVSPEFKLKVDSPCIVMLDRSGINTKVTVSTPAIAYRGINITITANGVAKTQRIVTPGGEQAGSSVSFEFESIQDYYAIDDPKASKAYTTYLPVEDVFVQGGANATTQYGLLGYMQLKNGTADHKRQSLIRYDLSRVNNQLVSKATLRLFVRGIRSDGALKRSIVARLVNTADWNEHNTTYSTFPKVTMIKESPPTYLGKEAQGQWIDIDVTDLIRAIQPDQNDNLVFELIDLTQDYFDDYVSFATKEFGYKGPQLILE
ncbi:polysaccharide lyase family 8 super-sandwich domain-containing protein [Vibrio sp. Hal054]|uniref:polysaccharide lyase family 8 super-sandwich domain-containing protein n=1 Tax=Vibrio sp. Hal054 TaxID=3035158 RepID=UPI00301E56FB